MISWSSCDLYCFCSFLLLIFLAEKPLKKLPEKKISVKQESTDKLENDDEKKSRYILFVGKSIARNHHYLIS